MSEAPDRFAELMARDEAEIDLARACLMIAEDRITSYNVCYTKLLRGPGAGSEGGRVVASGPPEVIAAESTSWTGRYLAPLLDTPVASA